MKNQAWIPLSKIQELVQLEPALVTLGLCLGAWLVYKLLLKKVTPDRHNTLQTLFKNLALHLSIGTAFFIAFDLLSRMESPSSQLERLTAYVGLVTVLSGAAVFVKVARILAFEYLFLIHMRVGVPVLLVNLFTLLMSMILTTWLATEIFNIRLAPLLATSAIFSIVLGLALQDTLGNLFAGVALQFDKPFEIGDWIEVQSGGQKWVGIVEEISWRATVLMGLADERITIPNRVVASSEVSNFSLSERPVILAQTFRLPYSVDRKKAEEALVKSALGISGVLQNPAPFLLIREAGEHWITARLVLFLSDYSRQFTITDQILRRAFDALDELGVPLAAQRISVENWDRKGSSFSVPVSEKPNSA